MAAESSTVFFFDVDNTLLDNDQVTRDLKLHIRDVAGEVCESQYWTIFEELRAKVGYADYLGTLQRFRQEHPQDVDFRKISSYLLDYPFSFRLFAGAMDAIEFADELGKPAILSDGDVVFQPWKILRSGLDAAVGHRVMIYIHKEEELATVEKKHPANHYVMIDDKIRLLTAIKQVWKERVTTVFVRQGHYAHDAELVAKYPAADISIEKIGDLVDVEPARLTEL